MTSHQYVIRFQDSSIAEANVLAESLRDAILDSFPGISIERQRDDPSSQDFGATLIMLLGAPAIVLVARGIENWLRSHQSAKLRIERDGVLIVEGLTGQQVIELSKLLKNK